MSSPTPPVLTPSEYLELERKSELRNEYIDGRMREMPRTNIWHSTIGGNLLGEISSQLRRRACEVFNCGLRVKVSSTGMYTYADIVALCGKPELEDEHEDTLLNPSVIIEVFSDSSEAYDRGEKFANYRRIESLREYVLVSQNKILVEHYRREKDQWRLSEVSGPDAVLHLESIDCHVAVSTIYEKVEFAGISSREKQALSS